MSEEEEATAGLLSLNQSTFSKVISLVFRLFVIRLLFQVVSMISWSLMRIYVSPVLQKRGRKQRGGQAAAKGGAKAPDENAEGQDVKLGDDDGAGGASGAAATGALGGEEAVEGGNVDENGGAGNGDGPPVSALASAMGGGGGGGEMEDMDVGPDQDDDDPDEKPAGVSMRSCFHTCTLSISRALTSCLG